MQKHKVITTPTANVPPKVEPIPVKAKEVTITSIDQIDSNTQVGKLLLAAIEILGDRLYEGNNLPVITKLQSKATLMFPSESTE